MEQLTQDNFYQNVIKPSYDAPVLVQFWAPWCGPCHGLTATLDQIEEKREFPIEYYGLDVDQFTDLALQYQVMGVPHTKIFVSGYPVDHFSDPLPAHEIVLFIKNALVIPGILRYSHFADEVDIDFILDLENSVEKSSRKEVYYLTLAKHFLFDDKEKSRHYLEKIPDESDQFQDRLFIESLYRLIETEFSPDRVNKKLWAAKNALNKRNFESTYQFLLQANLVNSDNQDDFPKSALLGFRQFLGKDHELNRKYQAQLNKIIDS